MKLSVERSKERHDVENANGDTEVIKTPWNIRLHMTHEQMLALFGGDIEIPRKEWDHNTHAQQARWVSFRVLGGKIAAEIAPIWTQDNARSLGGRKLYFNRDLSHEYKWTALLPLDGTHPERRFEIANYFRPLSVKFEFHTQIGGGNVLQILLPSLEEQKEKKDKPSGLVGTFRPRELATLKRYAAMADKAGLDIHQIINQLMDKKEEVASLKVVS